MKVPIVKYAIIKKNENQSGFLKLKYVLVLSSNITTNGTNAHK